MSNARYLWNVALGLRTQVRPHLAGGGARETLDHGIRILTAVANALEPGSEAPPALMSSGSRPGDTDRLPGPPENCAAHRAAGGLIADIAGALDRGAAPDAGLADAIRWEKAMIDAAVARIDAVEHAEPALPAKDGCGIDPDRLGAYLRRLPGCDRAAIAEFRMVSGGRSRQTALFTVTGCGTLAADMVIQRGIPGQKASAGFLTEEVQHHLLARLREAGMSVPRPVLFETDPQWLDAPFLLVERVAGAPVQPDYWRSADDEAVAFDLAREMALLHAQPVDLVGRGLPQARERQDLAGWRDELDRLAAEWNGAAHWPSITMSAAIDWLRRHVDCLDDRRAIVHNDMMFHNVLAQDGRITAILDWEQCAIGHPGEDLGYCYPAIVAVTDWERFVAAYRAAGGAEIPQRQIDYFALRAGLRLMNLVMKGGRDSFEDGLTDDLLVASAGAHFTQRLLHRIAGSLASILERHDD